MRYEYAIGIRHLTASRQGVLNTLTLLSVVGVAVGVAAFTTVVSVAGGFLTSFQDRVLGINPHVLVTKSGMYFSEYDLASEAILSVPGVTATAPFLVREMLATSAASTARPGVLVKGIDIDAARRAGTIPALVVDGGLDAIAHDGPLASDTTPDAPPAGAAIGVVLAEKLRAGVGDTLTLVSPLRGLQSLGVGTGNAGANYARVRVEAVIDAGYHDYDSRLMLMDYRAVQQLLGLGDVVMGIEVQTADPDDTSGVIAGVEGVLTTGRFRCLDWRDLNRNLFSSLQLQKVALSIVMSILLIVASLVILCVLVMLVLEKRREIAILRSMGASARSILRIFVFQGMAIGSMGTALGLVGGVVLCAIVRAIDFPLAYEVYRVRALPVDPDPLEFALTAIGALVICFVATIYPARRAAQVSPVDALRYD